MRRKYAKFELDPEYTNRIDCSDDINLAIVGKDPFPTSASSIPFVKDTWAQLDGRSAGRHLFRSIFGEDVEQQYDTPRSAAFALLDNGIVLLNASYFFLEKETPSRQRHFDFVNKSLDINYPILKRTPYSLLCGDAATMMKWVVEFTEGSAFEVPHPSPEARNALPKKRRKEWDRWWVAGQLRAWL